MGQKCCLLSNLIIEVVCGWMEVGCWNAETLDHFMVSVCLCSMLSCSLLFVFRVFELYWEKGVGGSLEAEA